LNAPLPHRKEATMQQFLFDRDWQQWLPFLVASKTRATAALSAKPSDATPPRVDTDRAHGTLPLGGISSERKDCQQ